jgi:hypothetical protein
VLPNTDPIHKVSIVARGRALGWTLALPTEDKYLRTRSELRDELAMLLGGRTAEELIFGDPTTGAADDIERATNIARAMVTEFGMSDTPRPRKMGEGQREVFLGLDGNPPGRLLRRAGHRHRHRDPPPARRGPRRGPRDPDHAPRRAAPLAESLVEHETLDDAALWRSSPASDPREVPLADTVSRATARLLGRLRPSPAPSLTMDGMAERRVVLFDLDGCILDSTEPILRCHNAALAEFGLPPIARDDLARHVGPPLQVTLAELLAERSARGRAGRAGGRGLPAPVPRCRSTWPPPTRASPS